MQSHVRLNELLEEKIKIFFIDYTDFWLNDFIFLFYMIYLWKNEWMNDSYFNFHVHEFLKLDLLFIFDLSQLLTHHHHVENSIFITKHLI